VEELSALLRAAYGVTDARTQRRAAPSAGGLYAADLALFVRNVEQVEPGLYLYSPESHSLRRVFRDSGAAARLLAGAALDQYFVAEAACWAVLIARTGRIFPRYGVRGFRYLYLDAGHIAQNIYLAAAALELACCEVAAFYDDRLNALLGLDGEQDFVTTTAAVGRKKQESRS